MGIKDKISSLSLKEMISQMFILGFSGTSSKNINNNILKAVQKGLGGIIFFAHNIDSHAQTKELIDFFQNNVSIPLFISIDQEGGLVERTINIKDRVDYLTPAALAQTGSIHEVINHTKIMAEELKFMGFNMNFAPVLDVNTNKLNPVIGIRSFGNNPDNVTKYAISVIKTFQDNNIIPVGKHFPGHGEAKIDSHLDMPSIDMELIDLENIHIKPFNEAFNNDLDALMIAHVNYSAFNKDPNTPASLSKEVITDYLKERLNYKGLIISDDMDMGGIKEHYSNIDACIKAINAGVDILIYRDSTDEIIKLIDQLEEAVENEIIPKDRIVESVTKILESKEKYQFVYKTCSKLSFDFSKNRKEIEEISLKSVKIHKKGKLLPFKQDKKTVILAPDKAQIFNYSKDNETPGEIFNIDTEILYSLNPSKDEIALIKNKLNNYDKAVFISYNSLINKGQIDLFNAINIPSIVVIAGSPYDTEAFLRADSIIITACYKNISLKNVLLIN